MPTTLLTCSQCEEHCSDENYTDCSGDLYCKECYESDYFSCESCSEGFIDLAEHVDNPDNEYLCESCWEEKYTRCEDCEEVICREDAKEGTNSDYYCDFCWDAHFFKCSGCGETTEQDFAKEGTDGDYYCDFCWSDNFFECFGCGDTIDNDHRMTTPGGDSRCEYCWSDICFTCDGCGGVFWNDDTSCSDNGCYCSNCHGADEGDFLPRSFCNTSGKTTLVGSKRCYGLELETHRCDDYFDLEGKSPWGAKNDCTVAGKEFYSAILQGDKGLEVVDDWAKIARKKHWKVNKNCGYHLHLDMQNENDDSLFAIAYAYRITQKIWFSFVGSHRHNNTYSHKCLWNLIDLMNYAGKGNFTDFINHIDTRYNWLNVCAYYGHKSFEIRLHEGTCDSEVICNWIKAHTRFADWAATKGLASVKEALDDKTDGEMFDIIVKEAWQDSELAEYYRDIAMSMDHGCLTAKPEPEPELEANYCPF